MDTFSDFYILNLSAVFETNFFKFYYYNWKGGAQIIQFSTSASLWGKKAKANQKSLLLIAEKQNVKLNPWYVTGFVDGRAVSKLVF